VAGCGAGSDYQSSSLSTVAGFNPATEPVGNAVRFDSSTAFVAAVADALATAQPLGLFIKMNGDTSGSNYIRLASDDHATTAWRPELIISYFDHFTPIIDPGPDSTATVGVAKSIHGVVTRGSGAGWSSAGGPGPVFVTALDSDSGTFLFTTPGTHLMRLSGSNAHGETSRTLAVEVSGLAWTAQQIWRQTHFGTDSNTGPAADLLDADNDGIANLLEYAAATDPATPNTFPRSAALSAGTIAFTYTRSKAATDLTFTVEWSETLVAGSWSTTGIADQTPPPDSSTAETETLTILVPAGSGKRFVRLLVRQP
jgi:hypothetical protein